MDLTGVSKGLPPYPEPGYGKAITLISPIHFVTCKHWNIRNAGDSVDFVDRDGRTLTRKIVEQIPISIPDVEFLTNQ